MSISSSSKKSKSITSASSSSGDTSSASSCTSKVSEDGAGQQTDSTTTITTFDEADSESESGDSSNDSNVFAQHRSNPPITQLVRNHNNTQSSSSDNSNTSKKTVVSFHSIDTIHTIPSLKDYTRREIRRIFYSSAEKEKMLDKAMNIVETKIDTVDGGLATIKKESVKRFRRYRGLEPLTSVGETEMDKQIDQRFDSVMKEQDCQSLQAGTYTNNPQTIEHNIQIMAAKSRVMSAESCYNAYLVGQDDEEEAINVFSRGTFLQDDMMRPFVDDSSPSSLSWKVKLEIERKAQKNQSSSRQPKRKKLRCSSSKQQQTKNAATGIPCKPQRKRTPTRRRRSQQDKLHHPALNKNDSQLAVKGIRVVPKKNKKTKKKKAVPLNVIE